jgi:hypothetical protein
LLRGELGANPFFQLIPVNLRELYHRSNFRHETNFARKALYVYLIKGHYTRIWGAFLGLAGASPSKPGLWARDSGRDIPALTRLSQLEGDFIFF